MDQERLQNINREIGDEKILHARRDVEIEADTVVFYGGARSHQKASVRWKREGVKQDEFFRCGQRRASYCRHRARYKDYDENGRMGPNAGKRAGLKTGHFKC
jgi:hypothetical protein